MIKVNILTLINYQCFLQQLDKNKYPDSEYLFSENSDEDIIWDVVVVYEGIKKGTQIKCRKGGLIFISGEPPMSRVYPKKFIKQFDTIITSHPNLKHECNILSQQALNWFFGLSYKTKKYQYNFDDLVNLPTPAKFKNISIITSSKAMMPGHNRRQKLIKFLKKEYDDKIDYFGEGINEIEYKSEALLPYRFHICLENSSIYNYWTEKIADPLLGYCVPIYSGCKNIEDYFDIKGYESFNIRNFDSIKQIIDQILLNPVLYYDQHINGLIENRNRLLHKYNLFDVISPFFCKISKMPANDIKLQPANSFRSYKILLLKLRLKRIVFKILIKLNII